jgi:hypothetical protein
MLQTNDTDQQLSPQALEHKYTDALSQFQSMMTSDIHDGQWENAQAQEQRPVLQQLSPVSKFLKSIHANIIQPLDSTVCDPGERDIASHACILCEDETTADAPKAKHQRLSG